MTGSARFSTRSLSREASTRLLEGLQVGRMAFREGARIHIRPVAFAHDRGWIFGRTADGAKVSALVHDPWVTFQADRIRTLWDWESVSVQGAVHFFEPGSGESGRMHARALAALSTAFPGLAGGEDPGAFRRILFGIEVQEIEGLRGTLEGDDALLE